MSPQNTEDLDLNTSSDLGNQPLSVAPYVSEEFYSDFLSGVYRKSWINIGRVEEISGNGDYIVRRIPTVESGVLVIRGKDGEVRAMHNVCPHRGNELVWDDKGQCKRSLTCRFHGWAFSPEGKLLNITDPEYFPGLDVQSVNLTPIHLAIWRGFIFINLSTKPEQSLEEFLGDLGKRLTPYPFEKCTLRTRYTVKLRANWLVVMDAFQEAYHAGFLHGIWTNGDPRSKIMEVLLAGQHRTATFSLPGRNAPTPVEVEAIKYGKTGLYASSEKEPIQGVNPGNHENFLFDCNVIFPNLFIDVTSRNYWLYRMWPTAHNESVFEIDLFDVPPENYAEVVATAYSRVRLISALLEDLSTLERTQHALESGAMENLIVGDEEILVRHGHMVVSNAVENFKRSNDAR